MMARKQFIFALCVLCMAYGAITSTVLVGCSTVGVADPDVRMPAYRMIDHLVSVYDNSHLEEVAVLHIDLADKTLNSIPKSSLDAMTDLDKTKFNRLRAGIAELRADIDDAPFVRQKALSMSMLAGTLGMFKDTDYIEEIKSILEVRKQNPQTIPEDEDDPASE
jgi:hypothetical protein